MTINEIFEKLSILNIKKKRSLEEDYLELVFYKKDIKAWDKLLMEIMGPAIKPYRKRPSREHDKLTKPYGGIRSDQTLYKKGFDKYVLIATIWPWGDRQHMTLKIPLIGNEN